MFYFVFRVDGVLTEVQKARLLLPKSQDFLKSIGHHSYNKSFLKMEVLHDLSDHTARET